jgi:hypothetical protein
MIPGLQVFNAGTAFEYFAAAFVSENSWKCPFGVLTRQRKCVGMANATGVYFQQYLAFTGSFDFNFLDLQWLFWLPRDCCFGFHGLSPDYFWSLLEPVGIGES